MKSLSFTEFRKRASEILTLVEKAETVCIIRHGKTVAKIVPAETEEKIPSWKQPAWRLVRPAASLKQGDFGGKAEVTLNVFFDSSALAKRHIEEKGSDQVQAILSSASALAVSVICVPEIVSALCRRRRERKILTEEYRNAKASVLSDIHDATVIGITEEVIAQAVALLEQFPLRSANALHVACASALSTDLFVSADDRQCKAARARGLRVEAITV